MSLSVWKTAAAALSFPRVSGDEPAYHVWHLGLWRFSPRERG